jgi:hypothetical protein
VEMAEAGLASCALKSCDLMSRDIDALPLEHGPPGPAVDKCSAGRQRVLDVGRRGPGSCWRDPRGTVAYFVIVATTVS